MNTTDAQVELLQRALRTAVDAHAGQIRIKSPVGPALPYAVHPMEVMKTLWDWGVEDVEVLAAALLHDCLEDTTLEAERLQEQFGMAVRRIVEELTFLPAPDWDAETRSKRKAEYLADFQNRSLAALLVKVADRLCNSRDFLRDNPRYAVVYYGKADELIKSFAAKSNQIAEHFGEIVVVHAQEAILKLEAILCEHRA